VRNILGFVQINKFFRFARALSSLRLKKTWGPFVEAAEITGFDHAFSISWSQGGEDLALLHAIIGKRDGLFIDVGAHHPSRFSVTRHLHQLGWSGVNVDANQELINAFKKARPRDINLCAAVGLEPKYTFTIFEEAAISTLDSEWRSKFINENNKIAKEVEVEGRKLRSILDDFQPQQRIDLLSIDAEGSDLQVLQSLEFETLEKSRFPKWLLLEAAPPVSNAFQTPAVKLAIEWGYDPHMVLAMSILLKFKD
jgi:FkbM family methyltransferase